MFFCPLFETSLFERIDGFKKMDFIEIAGVFGDDAGDSVALHGGGEQGVPVICARVAGDRDSVFGVESGIGENMPEHVSDGAHSGADFSWIDSFLGQKNAAKLTDVLRGDHE